MTDWEDRFWAKVKKTETCWLWTGAASQHNGAGEFWFNGKTRPAHRASYELHYGPVPPGAVVRKTCEVPACVRPDHLVASGEKIPPPPILAAINTSEWTRDALCARYDPMIWDGETAAQTRFAKRICKLCPAATRTACLDEALETDEKFTIRGGLTPEERGQRKRAS